MIYSVLTEINDDLDDIHLEQFTVHAKNRRKYPNMPFDGILLEYRNTLSKYIDTNSKFIQWFSIKGTALNLESDMLYGIIYAPPRALFMEILNLSVKLIKLLVDLSRN